MWIDETGCAAKDPICRFTCLARYARCAAESPHCHTVQQQQKQTKKKTYKKRTKQNKKNETNKNNGKEPIKSQHYPGSHTFMFLCSLHALYVPFVFMFFHALLNCLSTAILIFSPAITLFCHWFALRIFPLTV